MTQFSRCGWRADHIMICVPTPPRSVPSRFVALHRSAWPVRCSSPGDALPGPSGANSHRLTGDHARQDGAGWSTSFAVEETDQIMLVTDKGQLIRTEVNGIRLAGRSTQGVIVFDTWTMSAWFRSSASPKRATARNSARGRSIASLYRATSTRIVILIC